MGIVVTPHRSAHKSSGDAYKQARLSAEQFGR